MKIPFIYTIPTWELALFLFASMMLCIYLGNYIGKRYHKEYEREGTVLGSLFALLGLLLAFTFSMSVNRHDKRLDIIVEESNDIGTAILRADLYPEDQRQLFRADFKQYVEARIAFFNAGTDLEKIVATQKESGIISQRMWDRAMQQSKIPTNQVASMQMIPALNAMIDITNTRWYANIAKVPDMVLYLLYILTCSCGFYSGYLSKANKKIDLVNIMGFCILTCMVVWVIIDMDRPRTGFVNMEKTHQAIVDLRNMFR